MTTVGDEPRDHLDEPHSTVFRDLDLGHETAFWSALLTAPWSGLAYLDSRNLLLAYPTLREDRRYDVAIRVHPVRANASLLEVGVSADRSERSEGSTPPTTGALARELASRIDGLRVTEADPPLDGQYRDLSRDLELAIQPPHRRVLLNGVPLETDRGLARIGISSGLFGIEVLDRNDLDEAEVLHQVGLYHADAEVLPNLAVFAGAAFGVPQVVADVIAIPVPPGTGTAVGVGARLLGRVFVVVGAVVGAIEIGKAVKVEIDTRKVERENDRFARSCCCTWRRLEAYSGFTLDSDGNVNQGIEIYNRVFARTVVRVSQSDPCDCGLPPAFPPTTVVSGNIFNGQTIPLAGGPPTGGPTAIPDIECPRNGFSPPYFREGLIIRLPR